MIETLKNAFRNKDIRKKIIFTLLLLLLFRVGCYIPIPGLTRDTFASAVTGNDFLALMSGITGSALANGTLFALGIGPYINASIIMQLLTVGIPALERLSKQGEEGRKKITNITRLVTIILAIVQSIGIIVLFGQNEGAINTAYFGNVPGGIGETGAMWIAGIFMTIVYTAGSCLVMWIGERITEYGVGNGISMIIFIGILSTAGTTIVGKFETAFTSDITQLWSILAFVVIAIVIFFAIVYVDLAERKIPVQYAKQVRGTKMYGGQSSVIPMKITGSGVMPLIFAYAIISFPSMIMSLVPSWSSALDWWTNNFQNGTYGIWYILVLCVLIFIFSFFYAQIQFNPEDVSRNIQQNGGFIQGIRPGKPTAEYLARINKRITLFGAIFLTLVAFVPSIAFSWAGDDLVNVFSTTGILIVVSVALEFDKQLQSQILMKNYKGFLK
ncbi:MAG TPA: preprotein translocase subunit SecY [Firmicutes bacterium]|nr:preprotein translocase subunit SecY [Bacillota bacterium]